MKQLKRKILYFIKGSYPTEEEAAEAAKLNTQMFRNASAYAPEDPIEDFDAVAGCAPEAYLRLYGEKLKQLKKVQVEPLKAPTTPPSPGPLASLQPGPSSPPAATSPGAPPWGPPKNQ